MIPEMRLALHL